MRLCEAFLLASSDIASMNNADWNNLRSRLHHDWLQKYFTLFDARADEMDRGIIEKKLIRADILKKFDAWQAKEPDFEALINEAVFALSPKQLLDEHPLSRMPDDDKAWLGDVIHALYLERTKMQDKLVELAGMLSSICLTHALLKKLLQGENGELREKAGERPVKRFYGEMREFSRVISSLPHEVQVV